MNIDEYIAEAKKRRHILLSIARNILGNDDDAEDVVQDALLRLWQLHDEPIANVESMAKVIVRNLSVDVLRRRRQTSDIDDADICADDVDDEHDDRLDAMMAMVAELPTMQQTVIRLRHFEGMEMKQIADLIGTTEQAVRKTLSRARKSIFEQFKNKVF